MALSGYFYGTTANDKIRPKITWSAVQNIPGNYSDITATLSYSRTNTGYSTEGDWTGSLSIGSSTGSVSSVHLKITYNSNTVAITHTARVYHDSYGDLSLTISAQGRIYNPSSSTLRSTTISGSITLDTIPRASTISATNADIGSRSTVVVARKNDSFTHSIAYRFGTLSGYIDADGNPTDTEVKLSATTVNFLLPESFYGQIPDSPTGKCTLTCRTYSGSTVIGSDQTATFTATAAESLCAPAVRGMAIACDSTTLRLTGSENKFVRYVSTAACQMEAVANKGASIVETTIQGVAAQYLDIERIETDTVTFRAKDSRGYVSTYTVQLDMVPYILLTNNATVQRTDPTSGNAVLTLEGNCWNGSFGAVKNELYYEYTVDGGPLRYDRVTYGEDYRYQEGLSLSGLDYTTSHTVWVRVKDLAMTVEKTLTVHRGIPVFDWGEGDFRFHVPVECPGLTINGQSLEAYIRTVIQNGQ